MAGSDLAKMRLQRGLSQAQIADALNISRAQVSRLENNLFELDPLMVSRLATLFEADEKDVLRVYAMPVEESVKIDSDSLEYVDSELKITERIEDLRLSLTNELENSNTNSLEKIRLLKSSNDLFQNEIDEQKRIIDDLSTQISELNKELTYERKQYNKQAKTLISLFIIVLILLPFIIFGIMYYINTLPVPPADNVPVPVIAIDDSEV